MSKKQRLEDKVILSGKPGKRTEEAKRLFEEAGIPYGFQDLSKAKSYDPEFEPLPSVIGRHGDDFHGLKGVRDYITIHLDYKKLKATNLSGSV